MKFRSLLIIGLIFAMAFAVGLGAGTEEPRRGGTIVLMGHHELAGLSPDDIGPTVTEAAIFNIHNALIELDHNLNFQPVLAKSYEISPDGLTITFHLRRGVLFHDGTPFTSADVKYTYEFYGDPANAALIRGRFVSVDRIETPDDYTVVVHLKEPDATFLTLAATTRIVPKHYHMRVGQAVYRTAPIGTGPFKLVEWRPAEFTLLRAFDDHFRGRPHIDYLRIDVVPEATVRAMALEMGMADASIWPFLVEDNLRFAADPRFKTFITASLAVNHFRINTRLPQFQDKRVRQAMMYATDRQRMIDEVFAGAAVVAHTNKSPALEFWFNPYTRRYDFNPEKAKALLDEAGWRVGPDGIRVKDRIRLSFTLHVFTGDVVRMPQAELMQYFLRAVGIEMLITETPAAVVTAGMRAGTKHAQLHNWTFGSTEPCLWIKLHSRGGDNRSHWSHPRVDELLDMGRREMNLEKRRAIYWEIQEIVAEEVPFLFMMYWDWFNSWNKRVRGLPETALSGSHIFLYLMHTLWIDE
ncbi:ABC transporter substrate-binding protein [Candidatus Acetothermia bacterium]|jgi:peptide/nickel transport system substrate-binding protein|nr:ABC transporter substrate-binding protein [Candidatus Acetothermia bacterium]MCI2427838.1 ABC transporter substrate-binding protein [Candidatus Acetothermia bacterium]MCI2428422.1 ABC transporter substrate-binding protein [Candidatus Acetothermia bacterium]